MKKLLKKLLCFIGFHWWVYYGETERVCSCGRKEFLFRGVEIWVKDR